MEPDAVVAAWMGHGYDAGLGSTSNNNDTGGEPSGVGVPWGRTAIGGSGSDGSRGTRTYALDR